MHVEWCASRPPGDFGISQMEPPTKARPARRPGFVIKLIPRDESGIYLQEVTPRSRHPLNAAKTYPFG
jgi:hypothetical protein